MALGQRGESRTDTFRCFGFVDAVRDVLKRLCQLSFAEKKLNFENVSLEYNARVGEFAKWPYLTQVLFCCPDLVSAS